MYKTLSDSILFRGLSERDVEDLLKKINYQIKKYNSKNIIALSGEKCNYLMIVLKGYVKGEMIDYSGKTIKIEDIHAPKPIAIAFIFGKNNTLPVNVEAVTDTELLLIQNGSIPDQPSANHTTYLPALLSPSYMKFSVAGGRDEEQELHVVPLGSQIDPYVWDQLPDTRTSIQVIRSCTYHRNRVFLSNPSPAQELLLQ